MSKFKVGDRVRLLEECWPGKVGEVWPLEYNENYGVQISFNGGSICLCQSRWELVTETTPNTTLMSSVTSIIKKLTRQEPEKSFVAAGFLDENENITEKGAEALRYVLWEANKEAVKKIADQVIEAESEKK